MRRRGVGEGLRKGGETRPGRQSRHAPRRDDFIGAGRREEGADRARRGVHARAGGGELSGAERSHHRRRWAPTGEVEVFFAPRVFLTTSNAVGPASTPTSRIIL